MDVIAHNLANVNTAGFKASRTTFTDIFSQTLQGASQANEGTGRGGTNPMQVGLGANVSAIDRRMTQGAAMRTDVPLDMMIQGEGFFIVGDNSGTFFTRAGAFRMDPTTGWLVNDQGMPLQGWNINEYFEIQTGMLETIVLDMWTLEAESTEVLQVTGNLDPTGSTAIPPSMSMEIFDSLGVRWVFDVTFVRGTGGTWTAQAGGAGSYLRRENRADEYLELPAGFLNEAIVFDSGGRIQAIGTPPVRVAYAELAGLNNLTGNVDFDPATFGFGATGEIVIDFSRMTQFANLGSDPRADRPLSASVPGVTGGPFVGGMRAGHFDGISVGPDGIVRGRFTNGEIIALAQIPIAVFRNPAGLESVGNNLFVETANSGAFDGTGQDVSLGGATMLGGVLEMSNVDLAGEFTDMIITQRGFQSNSRIISVSDEMLQILNNL